ncbi:MAG TPA: 50S ribosomal protein L20 [Candidatus Micrarchaeia archaeon]|nr:50S ribosomal protein L20 [Candidatus Micrarchaeia archaeon]
MARVKRGVTARQRHRKLLQQAEGFSGTHRRLFRPANEAVLHALAYQYRDRRKRKGDFRRLWIARINAACRQHGLRYSDFIHRCQLRGVGVDRKQMAELAVRDPTAFERLVAIAREPAPGS